MASISTGYGIMPTYVIRDGKLVEKQKTYGVDAPNIISDEMSETRHMADGKHYTSKKKFRQATKDAGCIEIGDQDVTKPRQPVKLDRAKRREDIKRAVWEIQNGLAPTIKQILSGEER